MDALPFTRGELELVMGDADCTYDFRRLAPFVDLLSRRLRVRPSGWRWKGSIEPGSMPALHRYFGFPFADVDLQPHVRRPLHRHPLRNPRCFTHDALERMSLQSQWWEYTSEMVLKSVHMELRNHRSSRDVALKDRNGHVAITNGRADYRRSKRRGSISASCSSSEPSTS